MNNPNGTRAVGTSAGEASMGLPWYSELALPVLAVDPDSFVVLWNQSLAEISGIDSPLKRRHDASENSSAATAPLPLANLLASHSQTVWSEALQTALAKGRAKCAIDLHGPTAATSFIATLATKQGTTNGELPFVVCFLEEQTSSPPAPPKTIASDESSTVISLQSLSMPVWGIDLNGKVSFWSNAMAALVGLEPNEAAESDLEHLVALADLPAVRHTLNEAMHGKSTSGLGFALQLNASSQKQQQTQKPVRLVSCVIPWRAASSDQIVGALVMGRPVSIHDETAHEWGRMIQTALAPIFGVDCKGRINEWNDFMAETTGFSAKEALQLNFIDTFVESDRREDVDVFLRDALQGNGSDTVEIEIRSRTGTVRSLLLSMSPRRNQSDEIIGVVFFARDTTESAKRDRAIAAIAAELRRLIDTANAPIFGIDYDGYVNEWNDKTAEITGYAKGEALGCSLVDSFVATQMRDSAREVLENAKQGFGTSNYELEFCTKSNDIRDLLVNVTARRDEHGHVVGVLIVAQDVTESVQRDRAVAGMALELRQLIDTANAPIFGIDADGNINEWNRRTQEITGYSKEETFDEPLVERFIAPSERKKVQEILDAALQGNETSNYEIEFISKSGEPRFMLVNATTRRDPESNVVGVVGVGQDVTEDRKYVEEIRKMHYIQATQEVKVETERNMTAYFAHELRYVSGSLFGINGQTPAF
jgi:PAS domain S-box-containing protein